MRLVDSEQIEPGQASPGMTALLETVGPEPIREWVQRLAAPRHFLAEAEQNRATADWLAAVFDSLGYSVERQGPFANIVAGPKKAIQQAVLVAAHYDSVPNCPGADDNASAVAAMLGCAAACRRWAPDLPVVFVAFNREEDGLMGSRDFVASYLPGARFRVECAHVLEMVGFASSLPGSQRIPTGLPLKLREAGDFLGLLANGQSSQAMELVLRHARTYVPTLAATGLEVEIGLERLFPVLGRSDHVPLWERGIPAVMWTDTAEFRNPHYHRESDTPSTLDYGFLQKVTQVLAAAVLAQTTRQEDV